MFGCICAGRPVQTNLQQVSPTKFVFTIEDAGRVNHIVVFLLGTVPLPANIAAGVYFSVQPFTEWTFLGYISNEKPSAVFRLGDLKPSSSDVMVDNITIQLGISLEPQQTLLQQSAIVPQGSSSTKISPNDIYQFAHKMLENLFNYAMSFSKPASSAFGGAVLPESIPTAAFKKWFENFEHKLQKDPWFWKT